MTTKKVNVWSYHWEIERSPISSTKKDVILAHCLDKDNQYNLLRFENEVPYFYLQLPDKVGDRPMTWTNKDCDKIMSRILYSIKRSKREGVSSQCMPVHYEIEEAPLLCFYEGDRKYKLLKLYFNNLEQAKMVERVFYYPIGVSGLTQKGKKIKFEVIEGRVGPIRRMMTELECGYCRWFETLVINPKVKKSTSNHEYIVSGTLKPLPNEVTKKWKGNPGIFTFDIECITDNERWPDPDLIGCPIVSIACKYKRSNEKESNVVNLVLANPIKNYNNKSCEIRYYTTEKSLIEGFFDLIVETDPEMIIGYNTYGFDNNYIFIRAEKLDVDINPKASRIRGRKVEYTEKRWSSKAYGEKVIGQIKMGGRIDIDVLSYVRANYKLQRYSLNYASKSILGEEKYDLKYDELFDIYRNYYKWDYYYHNYANTILSETTKEEYVKMKYDEAVEGLKKALDYGEKDTVLTHKIFDKAGIYEANREVCNVVGINIEDVLNRGQQMRGHSIVYDRCHRKGIRLNKVRYATNLEFTGGFVFVPIVGMHDDVMCIDFKSLYPSIIIAMNLCYSTLLKEEHWHIVKEEDCNIITGIKDKDGNDHEFRFVKPHIRKGILPSLLEDLLKERYRVKALMKIEKDPTLKNILNKKQLALKITANSIYGLTGVGFNKGVLPFKPVSVCTTWYGRKFIKQAAKYVEDNYNGTIVYGDTDSIMFKIPGVTGGKQCFEWGNKIAVEISKIYNDPVEFELEKAGRILCITKKKYMYWKYDGWKGTKDKPNPNYGLLKNIHSSDAMELRGNILVRRDNCEWYKKIYRNMLNSILEDKSPTQCFKELTTELKKLINGKIKPKDLVITTTMGSNYKSKSFKNAVFKICLRKRGGHVSVGERFGYVVVKDEDPKAKLGKRMRLIEEFNDNPGKWEIDYTYYFDLISRKNIDQLWMAGYSKVVGGMQNEHLEKNYEIVLSSIKNDTDLDAIDYITKEDELMMDVERLEMSNQEIVETLYLKYRGVNKRDLDTSVSEDEWLFKKAIYEYRNKYFSNRVVKTNYMTATLSLFKYYKRHSKERTIQKINEMSEFIDMMC